MGGGRDWKNEPISVKWDLRCPFLKSKKLKTRSILLFSDEETEAQISKGAVSVGIKLCSWTSIEEFGVLFFFDSVQKQTNGMMNQWAISSTGTAQERPLSNYKWRVAVFSATWQKRNCNWFKGNSFLKIVIASQ